MLKNMVRGMGASGAMALKLTCGLFIASSVATVSTPCVAQSQVYKFDIPIQTLDSALRTFARTSRQQILFDGKVVSDKRSSALIGDYSVTEGLNILLQGTGLNASRGARGAYVITTQNAVSAADTAPDANAGLRVAQTSSPMQTESPAQESAETSKGVPEILVKGSKILNMDIARSRDDAQPYVIFDRETLSRSGASNLEDFLKQRLTMNAAASTNNQSTNVSGNISQIDLHGLGTNQTLILVDGHRLPSINRQGTPLQPDINGIPLAAVERIEILPITASGIYGGSATGGVVNIIMRRDYSGIETKLTYDNSFSSDTALRRLDISAGFNLPDGRTNVLVTGSHSEQNLLLVGDTDFLQRSRAVTLANLPSTLLPPATPPLGATTNIRSTNGSPLFGPGTPNFTSVPVGYAGGGGSAPLQANAGRYNYDLADTAEGGGGAGAGLLNGPKIESLGMTLRREFSPRIQGFLELAAANNISHFPKSALTTAFTISATAPNNPFGQQLRVTVPSAAADNLNQSDIRVELHRHRRFHVAR